MIQMKCTSEFRTTDNEPLTASRELADFIMDLPADAVLSTVTYDKGDQREPWVVLVGLRASWEETR